MPGRLDEKFMKYGVVDFDVWQLTGSRDFTGKKTAKNVLLSQNSLRNIIHRLKKLITSLPFTVWCNSVITF